MLFISSFLGLFKCFSTAGAVQLSRDLSFHMFSFLSELFCFLSCFFVVEMLPFLPARAIHLSFPFGFVAELFNFFFIYCSNAAILARDFSRLSLFFS
jgi:hypothetical protein